MPKFTAEGVTRVIEGKLYVLPGTCSGEGPLTDPRYCETEPIRKLYRSTPSTNTWVGLRSAPHYHRGGAAARAPRPRPRAATPSHRCCPPGLPRDRV